MTRKQEIEALAAALPSAADHKFRQLAQEIITRLVELLPDEPEQPADQAAEPEQAAG